MKLSPLVHFCENIRGLDTSKPRQGRGDSAALRGTTRPWSFHGLGGAAGLPPLFAETILASLMKAEFPVGASANRAAIPAPNPSFDLKSKEKKGRARVLKNAD